MAKLLRRLSLLDAPAESAFDEVVQFAADTLRVPMAAISLLDDGRQWFKASVGIEAEEISSEGTFCGVVVRDGTELLVPDTLQDGRFAQSPLVTGTPSIRAYAGVPIRILGERIGTLCVLDHEPRTFNEQERTTLRFLGTQVEHLVDLHARRSIELPPSRETVLDAAERISRGVPIDEAFSGASRPSWVYDTRTLQFLEVNDAATLSYGWSEAEFLTKSILDVRPAQDRDVLRAVIADGSIDGYAASRLWRHLRSDGEQIDVKITSVGTVWRGRAARLVVATDVSAQVALSDALDRAAHIDTLTGLPNRRQFVKVLSEALASSTGPIAVLFIDLDRFKMVNDTMGHDSGDALLGAAGARVRACAPQSHQVARLGGDEFAVVQAVESIHYARQLAERIRARLEHPFVIDGIEYYVSASVGIALSHAGSTPQTLLAEADAAMYAAKDAGRNGCALFDMELRQRMSEWADTQRDLHHAVDESQIELDYQPIVNFRTGEVAYEALARWQHPRRGRLMPGAFIGVAEESGLINRLGAHILELGVSHAAVLGAPVTVNVSVRQFNRTLVQQVASLIARHRLEPGQLVIEVTESAVGDSDHAQVVLDGLRDAGARIWIDDFGTGFSSLARLNDLTFDGLKLAREFVVSLDDEHGWGIATAIVGIARALGIPVIAEGVETSRQLQQVRELGCEMAQGYLLGRPAPFSTREGWGPIDLAPFVIPGESLPGGGHTAFRMGSRL